MGEFDHLVIAARSLDEGEAWLAALGLPVQSGGTHPQMGTHNRLLSLGPTEYLELIAIDPAGSAEMPRWFGLDRFEGEPRLVSWVVRTTNPSQTGATVRDLHRGELRWRFSLPDDGEPLQGGVVPALIEWQTASHPADGLVDHGFRLKTLRLSHPDPLPDLPVDDPRITLREGPVLLHAAITGPEGDIAL